MNRRAENYPDYAATLLRLSLGSMWVAHALLKWFVFTIPGFAGWLTSQGYPVFMAGPIFLLELVGGVMILSGYYGRYVSLLLLPILLVATWSHLANGWVHTSAGGGWEYPLFLVFMSIAHGLPGDGRFVLRANKLKLS